MDHQRLGISGAIAQKFLLSELTPLLALVGILMGIFAVMVTPREEEPQIDVTFANIFYPYPGATAREVENLVSTPVEQKLSEIRGVEHVYSMSRPGMAVLTVQFDVGEPRTQSIVNLYNQIYSNEDLLPPHLGVGRPIIKPKGIDDVPIVSLTLWSDEPDKAGYDLQQVAHTIEAELKRVPGTRDIYTIGGPDQVVHILLDPQRMAGYDIAFDDMRQSLRAANATLNAGTLVSDNREIEIQAGSFLTTPEQVAGLVVGLHGDTPVYLSDVAEVKLGPDQSEQFVWFGTGMAADEKGITQRGEFPAVTIAIAKQPGTNAATIADQVIARIGQLEGLFIPEGVQVTVTRNYGATATDKAMTLIKKLIFATAAVVLLVLLALGWREAVIVGTAVVITLTITLFASWAWGFTLNRVSLFALIFSIGILVDDAIVVVENIHRRRQMGGGSLREIIPQAVDEVGGPTILATFTVIAALLPMAFVSGLMGPYMSPIPINASMGMFISLAVAFVVTPWLTYKIFSRKKAAMAHQGERAGDDRLYGFFQKGMGPFLNGDAGRARRWALFGGIMALILIAVSLAGFKLVIMKMLPFDNKSEFQVVVDMAEGSSVEQTNRVLQELGAYIATVPEVSDYQIYVGTAAPINFNGLVRQYYLRSGANVGDIQVNLIDKSERDRQSHDIALSVRAPLQNIGKRYNANVKIVEVPPGPPVQAPVVAEIYGMNYQGQVDVAKQLGDIFRNTEEVVDVDDSVEHNAARLIVEVDRQKAALLGVAQLSVVSALTAAIGGEDVGFLHGTTDKYPLPLRVELPVADKASASLLLDLQVRSSNGALVRLSEIVNIVESELESTIYHKDLLPVVFVTADVAGQTDSPLYGMFDIYATLLDTPVGGGLLDQTLLSQPENPYRYSVKWDGEWQVTYETFRDMGIAYGVGMILIYLLVVAQFRSYLVPLIIMAPIPLTIIGVMPGHALLGANFTATSMIGMIALAGIIVRNSILLVDFINQSLAQGMPFDEAVIRSGAVRAKPIILTGLAAMIGALFILDDPIFNGLAISLVFGIFVSTVLTLVVIPVMYYAFMRKR